MEFDIIMGVVGIISLVLAALDLGINLGGQLRNKDENR